MQLYWKWGFNFKITINFVLGQGMTLTMTLTPSCGYTFNQKEKLQENGRKSLKMKQKCSEIR